MTLGQILSAVYSNKNADSVLSELIHDVADVNCPKADDDGFGRCGECIVCKSKEVSKILLEEG